MYIYYQRKFIQIGGSEIFAFNLFEEINKKKKIFIFCLYLSNPCKKFIKKNYQSIEKTIITPSLSLNFLNFTLNFLFSRNNKIIFNYGLVEMFFIKFFLFRKIIYLAHDMFKFDEFNQVDYKKNDKTFNFRLFLIGLIEKKFNKVIVLTKMAQYERKKLFNYKPKVLKAAIRNIDDFSISRSYPLLLSIGRLVKKKNIDILLFAFKKINKIYPKIKLEVCGDGKEIEYLKEISTSIKLSNKIKFRGFVDDKKKMLMIKKSICVFCLDRADYDLVVWESLLHSKPVVCSDTMEISKKLIETGWVIKSKIDPSNIYLNTIKLIKKKRKFNKLKAILNNYTFQKYSRKITSIHL